MGGDCSGGWVGTVEAFGWVGTVEAFGWVRP